MKQSLFRALFTAAGLTLAASSGWAQTATTPATPATGVTTPAQQPAPAASKPAHAGHAGHRQGGDFEMGQLPQAVITQLALSPAQKAQFDAAQTARQEMRAARQSSMAAQQKTMEEQLAKDQLDPHAMMAQSNQVHARLASQREVVQKKWLSFWDGLSAEQRKTLTGYMKSRMAERANKGVPGHHKG